MGQGFGIGTTAAAFCTLSTLVPFQVSLYQCLAQVLSGAAIGLTVDLVSDVYAMEGRVNISKDVIVHANEELRHLYSFYTVNKVYRISSFLKQKHEWVVLESATKHFYTVQKCPSSGDLKFDISMTLRQANDFALKEAKQPTKTGEIRLHRIDHEFDLAEDLQVAYVIAWLRKEDPRWSFTTENSRHFAIKIRKALNDF